MKLIFAIVLFAIDIGILGAHSKLDRDLTTQLFIKSNVIHKTEMNSSDNDVYTIATKLPIITKQALSKIGQTSIGHKIYKQAISLKSSILLVEVTARTDPDYAVAFRVGFDELGQNAIHYTQEVATWRKKTLTGKPEKAGEEISSSTLGSLLAHELGHTEIGLSTIGVIENPLSPEFERVKDELRAIKFFENVYRSFYNMPLRRTYYKVDDAHKFLE